MKLTPQITFRNFSPDEAAIATIHRRLAKLDQFYDRITNCRVLLGVSQHHRRGNLYYVRIDLTVPRDELVVKRDPPPDQTHENLMVAIRDAFDRSERELQQYAQRLRGEVKHHEVSPYGHIVELYAEDGFGLIESANGDEVYFHQNSLLDADFQHLEVGQEVRFTEEVGEKGLQASTVKIVGKHHLHE